MCSKNSKFISLSLSIFRSLQKIPEDNINQPESQRITKQHIENCLFHLQNNILTKPSLDVRHRLLDVRMFDEFTTSNAESEHAALKSRGTGITNLTTLTDLFLKSMKSAEMRTYDKEVKNNKDLEKTETTTHAI